MKSIKILLLAFSLGFTAISHSGCSTAPSERVVAVQTLKAVGQSAEATVSLSAQYYQSGLITAKQARQVMDFYDQKFQPAYRLAVSTVQANLENVASPDLVNLAAQLSSLLNSFNK